MVENLELIHRDELARLILDVVPLAVLLVDPDLRILESNAAAQKMLRTESVCQRHSGPLPSRVQSSETQGELVSVFKGGIIPELVAAAYAGHNVVRQRALLQFISPSEANEIQLLITTTLIQQDGQRLVVLVLEDISPRPDSSRVLPICAQCKSIRDDQDRWESPEQYLKAHLDIKFTHGLCPGCLKEALSEVGQ